MRKFITNFGLVCLLFTMFGCKKIATNINECDGMMIKGWKTLLDDNAFNNLTHRKQTKLNPLTENSVLSYSNARYDYDTMITYTLSFPEGPLNKFSPDNACISSISLMLKEPIQNHQTVMLKTFFNFLKNKGINSKIVKDIRKSYKELKKFNIIKMWSSHNINAGFVNNFRGNLFVVQIESLNPFTKDKIRGKLK